MIESDFFLKIHWKGKLIIVTEKREYINLNSLNFAESFNKKMNFLSR